MRQFRPTGHAKNIRVCLQTGGLPFLVKPEAPFTPSRYHEVTIRIRTRRVYRRVCRIPWTRCEKSELTALATKYPAWSDQPKPAVLARDEALRGRGQQTPLAAAG